MLLRGLPRHLAQIDRTLVIGILNVTPDSFSDGGRFADPAAAIAHGLELAAAGADLVDVGGESTRPGATRVEPAEELDRVLPVVAGLVAQGVAVSIDTMRALVAGEAVANGAVLVNDVSGGLADPGMFELLAPLDVPFVIMHWRGPSATMSQRASYQDVVREVCSELAERVNAAVRVGIDPQRIVLDPGIGFAKDASHNWSLLRALPTLAALGHPVLIGASRKRFLGELLADGGQPRAVGQRDAATDAITTLAAQQRVWGIRVHEVRRSRDAVAVASAWSAPGAGGGG